MFKIFMLVIFIILESNANYLIGVENSSGECSPEQSKQYYKDGIFDTIAQLKKEISEINIKSEEIQNIKNKILVIEPLSMNYVDIVRIKNISSKLNLFNVQTVKDEKGESYILYAVEEREEDALFLKNKLKDEGVKSEIKHSNEFNKLYYDPVIVKQILWNLENFLKDAPTKVVVVERNIYIPISENNKEDIKNKETNVKVISNTDEKFTTLYGAERKEKYVKKTINKKEVSLEKRKREKAPTSNQTLKDNDIPKVIEKEKKTIKEINNLTKSITQKYIKEIVLLLREYAVKAKNQEAIIVEKTLLKEGDKFKDLTIETLSTQLEKDFYVTRIEFKEDKTNKKHIVTSLKKKYVDKKSGQKKKKEKNKNLQNFENKFKGIEETDSIKADLNIGKNFICDFSKIKRASKKDGVNKVPFKIDKNSVFYNKKLELLVMEGDSQDYIVSFKKDNYERLYLNKRYISSGRYCDAK